MERDRGATWSFSLLQSLHKYQEQGLFCDTRLKSVDGEYLTAHSCILAAASATLCRKLTNSETSESSYLLQTSLSREVLSWVVDYVYSGLPSHHDDTNIHASDILTAINELGLDIPELQSTEGVGVLNDWDLEKQNQGCKVENTSVHELDHDNTELDRQGEFDDAEFSNIKVEEYEATALESKKEAPSSGQPKKRPRRKRTPKKTVRTTLIPSDDDTDVYFPDSVEVQPRKQRNRKPRKLIVLESSNEEEENGCIASFGPDETVLLESLEKKSKKGRPRKNSKQKVGQERKVTPRSRNKAAKSPETAKALGREYRCEVCNKTFLQMNHLQQHAKTHALRAPHLCRFCGKVFARKKDMHTHESQTHLADEQFFCKSCNEIFSNESDLAEHRKVHVSGKEYSCSICDRVFNRRLHLLQHSRLHTGEKPFVCRFCGKAFAVRHNMTAHERIHTGEKPYKCNYCTMSFNQRNVLVQHERRHTGEKPYQCKYCDKSFAARHYVQNHERTHTGERPFQCSYCGSAFKKKDNLRIHERTHTGEKPFKCKYCPESFAIGHTLNVHERIHTGHKPYVCKTCGEGFAGRSALVSHEKQHVSNLLRNPPSHQSEPEIPAPMPVLRYVLGAEQQGQETTPVMPVTHEVSQVYGVGVGSTMQRPVYWTNAS